MSYPENECCSRDGPELALLWKLQQRDNFQRNDKTRVDLESVEEADNWQVKVRLIRKIKAMNTLLVSTQAWGGLPAAVHQWEV